MGAKQIEPYGTWRSPIDAATLARGTVNLGWLTAGSGSGALYWVEARPVEGRSVLVRAPADADSGAPEDLTPDGFYVRTLVHEYGGLCHAASGDTVFFSNFEDQRIWRHEAGGGPRPITPEPEQPRALRYADFELSPDGRWIYTVRERHEAGHEARNEIVRVRADRDGDAQVDVLVSGPDFVASPRLSPDGSQLTWIQWNHPNMPWDGTCLFVAGVGENGLETPRQLAGGDEESVFQPCWSPHGVLHFVSDRTGWWNLYRDEDLDGRSRALAPRSAEFGRPLWALGGATYAFLPDGRPVCTWQQDGATHLGVLEPDGLREVETVYTTFGAPVPLDSSRIACVAASSTRTPAVCVIDLEHGRERVLRKTVESDLNSLDVSEAEALVFPTAGGRSAYAYFYAPKHAKFAGPTGERPPLLVVSHGGPTGAASASLSHHVQFWTTRGFAVVDVDYGGSTGYGREYRNRLRGEWGVVDTEDCLAAARYLADRGDIDPKRMAIRGGSAGGYTTLCALTFHDLFAAGASYYGVADAEALARDTHKFESRYLDLLIGPYPEMRERYRERSPIHFAERLSCPVLLLQGLEDAVVPPAQAEVLVDALELRKLPHAYVPFEGEQHGFRKAENVTRSFEVELYFYGRIFGFEPADEIEPIEIANLA